MHPAFSVIFLTTLIGVGQGLFLGLFTAQYYSAFKLISVENAQGFYSGGSLVALLFLFGGLGASFFHLGHPERAWRAATQWRTSWLSREVIVLPAFIFIVFVYGALYYFGWDPNLTSANLPAGQLSFLVGVAGTVVCFALFLCTGMIYGCIKFLQEWHTPLTPLNYTLLGTASGFTLAAGFAASYAPELIRFFGELAVILTLVAAVFRIWALLRNFRIKHRSTLQTAIGVRHNQIVQKAQGAMGGSFNTREYFHGRSAAFLKSMKYLFLVLTFVIPVLLLVLAMSTGINSLLGLAFAVQYLGLIAERWFFFAQARHPQNLYYQTL